MASGQNRLLNAGSGSALIPMPPPMKQRSLRWEFVSVEEPGQPRAWRWQVFTAGGQEVMCSASSCDSLAACVEDAKKFGYQEPGDRA
jgi:hypothetical protein